eukprot:Stramenopile-MAST_4_protein_930
MSIAGSPIHETQGTGAYDDDVNPSVREDENAYNLPNNGVWENSLEKKSVKATTTTERRSGEQPAVNYADQLYAVTVAECSSSCPGCEAANVLEDDSSRLWLSHEGTPQHITLDLTKVGTLYPHKQLLSYGWYCWHSYTTNPRVVEVSVGGGDDWEQVGHAIAESRSGMQCFAFDRPIALDEAPSLRFSILENFGGDQVYLNRVFLYGAGKIETSSAADDRGAMRISTSSSLAASSDGDWLDNNPGEADMFEDNQREDESSAAGAREPRQDDGAWVEQELASARYYAQSQYLDRETLDWLYEDLDESATGYSDAVANRPSVTPSSSVESAKSLILQYQNTIDGIRGEPGNSGARLGVVMHRSGTVEVKVTPPPKNGEGDLQSKSFVLDMTSASAEHLEYSRTRSTEPEPDRSMRHMPATPDIAVEAREDLLEKKREDFLSAAAQENADRMLATHESARLKEQLFEMESEIERLAIGDSSTSTVEDKTASLTLRKSPVAAEDAVVPDARANSEDGKKEDTSRSTQLSIENMALMLERFNRHVSYLESRLLEAEEHILKLESSGAPPASGQSKGKPRRGGKQDSASVSEAGRTATSLGPKDVATLTKGKAFRQGVLKVLDDWEKDMVKGVLDPHISSVIGKLRKDLFAHVNENLGAIRTEVRKIHAMVEQSLNDKTAKDSPPAAPAKNIRTVKPMASTKIPTARAAPLPAPKEKKSARRQLGKGTSPPESHAVVTEAGVGNSPDSSMDSKQYRGLVKQLRAKLDEKQKTLEALEIVQRRSNRSVRRQKREYTTTVRVKAKNKEEKDDVRTFTVAVE